MVAIRAWPEPSDETQARVLHDQVGDAQDVRVYPTATKVGTKRKISVIRAVRQ
jgi:hypothetical protein